MTAYRIIDHTADLGIEVWAPDGPGLFLQSARALFDLLWDPAPLQAERKSRIEVSGADWPDLMVNWLRELLFCWTGRQRLIKGVTILAMAEFRLRAQIAWETYDPERHRLRHDIKAVTYHQIAAGPAKKGTGRWQARIIFDL